MLRQFLSRCFSHKLMVSNLPLSLSAKEVTEFMGSLGPKYKSITVPESPDTKSVKGYAVVEYALNQDCQDARSKLAGFDLHGRSLRVVYMKGEDDAKELIRPLFKHRNAQE